MFANDKSVSNNREKTYYKQYKYHLRRESCPCVRSHKTSPLIRYMGSYVSFTLLTAFLGLRAFILQ